ncbi:FUSC family protein [Cumulibacter manganitolerans]|uniref:FUSC family protein n=1 Tax=Cumulibacter manganitolerans TaxID=1884992 RepID=UPI0012979E3D|nr:hypothetical protein [Cumulibacter manganitolerans]
MAVGGTLDRSSFQRWLARQIGAKSVAALALKAALAAAIAWSLIRPFGGVADQYAYYAPLGAVVVVSSNLAESVHSSVATVAAIALGTTLALGVRELPVPGVVSLAIVVGVGTVLGAWRRLGAMSGWVPIAGLFTLVVGGADPERYMFAYLGLTGFGALIGVLVNLIAPPLPLSATREMHEALRGILADRLDWIAEQFEGDELPVGDEWTMGRDATEEDRRRAEDLISRTMQLSRVNWRARRWRDTAHRQELQGQALGRLVFLVDNLVDLLARMEKAHEKIALGPKLRMGTAEAVRATAAAVRSIEGAQAERELLDEAERATEALAAAIRESSAEDGDDRFVAGNLVVTLRRVQVMLEPS